MGFEPGGGTTRRRWLASVGAGAAGGALPGAVRAATFQLQPWPAEHPTPPLTLTDLVGKTWNLQALRGRPVVLNFWASWCEPCRKEMPSLQRLQARHAAQRLAVLTVNYKETLPPIRRFLDTLPLTLPILLDIDGDAAAAWTPRVFPTTVLVDRAGAARTSVIGAIDWAGAEASRLLRSLLTAAA